MNIIVPIQLVPDLVEELVIDDSGTMLDPDEISWRLSEFDDNAIEQAILIKEALGGTVTVIAPEIEGADDALFTASAKGADTLIRIPGDFEDEPFNTHAMSRIFFEVIKDLDIDLVLTGVATNNSIDGCVGPMLAEMLNTSYVGYVSGVAAQNDCVVVKKEFPGGLISELKVNLPAVLGIQAAETPPRYVPFSKTRQAMKESTIEEGEEGEIDLKGGLSINRMYLPEVATRAEMLEGNEEEIAERIIEILKDNGLL